MWLTPMRSRRSPSSLRRLFEDFFEPGREGNGHSMMPALDLKETDNAVIVEAELPGVDSKDVSVQVEGDLLVIRGERKEEQQEKDSHHYYQEFSYGMFEREIRLPADVESERADAKFQNGILKISLPKKTNGTSKARTIKIK